MSLGSMWYWEKITWFRFPSFQSITLLGLGLGLWLNGCALYTTRILEYAIIFNLWIVHNLHVCITICSLVYNIHEHYKHSLDRHIYSISSHLLRFCKKCKSWSNVKKLKKYASNCIVCYLHKWIESLKTWLQFNTHVRIFQLCYVL